MTDTNSGITKEQAEKIGVHLIQMPIIVNKHIYFEDASISKDGLIYFMSQGAEVSTSQPSPGCTIKMWDSLLKEYDSVVYIPMSSGLSSACASAKALALDYDGRVCVADTHRVSITMRQCVLDAVNLSEHCDDANEIVHQLENNAQNSIIYLGVDTMEYFKKSGRVTPSTAAISSALNIKPVLFNDGDKFNARAKVRGMKACKEKMIDAARKELIYRFANVPIEDIVVRTAGSFVNVEDAEKWNQQVQNAFPSVEVNYDALPCSIVCHTGLNAAGIGISKALR